MSDIFPFTRNTDRFRLALCIEFKGTHYSGWQVQNTGVPTIQAFLQAAISRVANEPVATFVAGRTDAGVHATNQVVHFDTASERSDYGWLMGINSELPMDIRVKWVCPVDERFHARFSATERVYRFVIHNEWVRSAHLHELATWERNPLDAIRMQAAADLLLGRHDFSAFRAAECQAHSPVKTLKELSIRRFGDLLVLQVRADGFLHHMVRNLVGVLLAIGREQQEIDWARQVLEGRERRLGGVTAKGTGLYFVRARYDLIDLPNRPAGPSFIQPIIDTMTNPFDPV